jgi:hypothetical protein
MSGMPLPGDSITVPFSRLQRWYMPAPAVAEIFAPRQYCQSSVTHTPPTSDIVDVASTEMPPPGPIGDVMHGTACWLVMVFPIHATHALLRACSCMPSTTGTGAVNRLPVNIQTPMELRARSELFHESPWPTGLVKLFDPTVS